jgi:hypothetical protein
MADGVFDARINLPTTRYEMQPVSRDLREDLVTIERFVND